MISELKACQSRIALAHLIGVEAKELSFVLYKMLPALKYSSFCISKKNGGTRNIAAPCPRLKWIQGRLLAALYECEADLATMHGRGSNLDFGFRRGTNIYDNANEHRGRRYVLNIDIESYFDQFNFGRVRAFFLKNQDYALHKDVATAIAQIACFNNVLPQGAPTSPHIANMLTHFFDRRMVRFLRARRCTYSRYADDITISTNLKDFPQDVAVPDGNVPQGWTLAPEVSDIFTRAWFPINPKKTRMSIRGSRQMVTGLVVNQRPNVTREYYLTTRAACHSLFKTGTAMLPPFTPAFGDNCPPVTEEEAQVNDASARLMAALEGRLSHIHHIREKTDLRKVAVKQEYPTQFWSTLQLFYIYKYFVANRRPIVLTEGPSDIYYLRTAIMGSSSTTLTRLRDTSATPPRMVSSFFRFDTVASHVLGLRARFRSFSSVAVSCGSPGEHADGSDQRPGG
jgi:hypothetical protein